MNKDSVTVSARIGIDTQKQVLDLCEGYGISSNAFFRELIENTMADPYGMAIHSIATKEETTSPRYGYIRALLKVANVYAPHLTDTEKDALRRAMEIASAIFAEQIADLVKQTENV